MGRQTKRRQQHECTHTTLRKPTHTHLAVSSSSRRRVFSADSALRSAAAPATSPRSRLASSSALQHGFGSVRITCSAQVQCRLQHAVTPASTASAFLHTHHPAQHQQAPNTPAHLARICSVVLLAAVAAASCSSSAVTRPLSAAHSSASVALSACARFSASLAACWQCLVRGREVMGGYSAGWEGEQAPLVAAGSQSAALLLLPP